MRVANVTLQVYKETPCIDDYGRRRPVDNNECTYSSLGELTCVRYSPVSLGFEGRGSGIVQQQPFDVKKEVATFVYHNIDQAAYFDITTDDFLIFTMGTLDYVWKIVKITSRPAFQFKNGDCMSVRIIGERIEPRECPKQLIDQYKSDGI